MIFFLSIFTLTGWIYLVFVHGKYKGYKKNTAFWTNKVIFEQEDFYNHKNHFNLCVIIPARNEEKNITETLKSLINQNIKNIFILIIDDNSIDNTKQNAHQTLQNFKNLKFKIIKGEKLPAGWSGKVWALKQGVDIAVSKNFSHFLFMDSDIILHKNIIKDSISYLEEKNLKMFSLMAKLKCKTKWEKLLIPSFIYFFQKLFPFNQVNSKNNKLSAAAGGFILCKSEIFKDINLYEIIKDKIIDDCNLAKLIKKNGKVWLSLTTRVESRRSYQTLSEIWKMVSRTAYEQLNNSILNLILSIFGLFMLYIFPLMSLIFFLNHEISIVYMNLVSLLLMTATFIPTINFYKISPAYYISLPFSGLLYTMMTISSAKNYYFNDGNIWKGRKY
jgi:hopene-associated glycosyltransferase HpnB